MLNPDDSVPITNGVLIVVKPLRLTLNVSTMPPPATTDRGRLNTTAPVASAVPI